MIEKKIALFGGTFDPVHLGHTAIATAAVEHIGTEKIIFVPAKQSALKNDLPTASSSERFAMVALAIADNEKFQLSDYELKKTGPSYTLETVRQFQADYGGETLIYWLVGADCIEDLPQWYGIAELIDRCNLCVMFRAGYKLPNFDKFTALWGHRRIEKLRQNVIETPLVDISSTEIRNCLAAGRDTTGMLHPAVADYISKNRCYLRTGEQA